MAMLKVTSKGQVTLKKEVLQHLGAQPGDSLNVDLLANGRVSVSIVKPEKQSIEGLFGMVKNTTGRVPTIDDINEAIAAGWAGEVKY
ncbi:AbrB/MazE/SpoVT family DNA-binding domain-containing protein [Pararhizobium sp. DWP3-4]|uniref:AbrB/MazE/SpoVT family DNA-binding domain-containing protein n=1 Tax=Pararhizobium sp. DWP3-4 TaxID=2804565 RepID=UPI003CFA947D